MTSPVANLPYSVAVVAPYGRDARLICDQLAHAQINALCLTSVREMCDALSPEVASLIIAEESLTGDSLHCLADVLTNQPPWSDIPVIILTSGGKTTRSSIRMVNTLGTGSNMTLLERPVRILTLVAAVQAALRARQKQHEVRDLLLQSERSLRQRDQFLAMLGHELRNPIGTIRNAIEVLESLAPKAPDDIAEQRAIIRRQARHMGLLIDDLLDVSRITTGKIALHRIVLDLSEIVRRCLQAAQPVIEAERHLLNIQLDPQPLIVNGDPVRLEQIITNLLTNAIKYTPTRGEIWVSAHRNDGYAVVTVRDNGLGIAPELLPHIFDLFTQGHHTLDRAHGGLGIGLTVVRTLVQMHDGAISASSPGHRQGSTFTLQLPLCAGAPAPGETRVPSRTPKRRVLIVEDIADSRKALRVLLQLCGHVVEVAEDGLEGVEKAVRTRPEIALVDIGLPKLDGYQVAREIRSSLGASIRLIALTGYGQPDDQQRALEAGFDLHLTKPVDPQHLFQSIEFASG
jgi:signal transduction histidine kinase/CheY-like chemotaxis protein